MVKKMSVDTKKYSGVGDEAKNKGYSLDPLHDVDLRDIYLGGKKVGEYLDEGIPLVELKKLFTYGSPNY